MTEASINGVLSMVKADIGITSETRDGYILSCINGTASELSRKGIELKDTADDMKFLADYTAWEYRHRDTGEMLPQNLLLRERNRIARVRAGGGSE